VTGRTDQIRRRLFAVWSLWVWLAWLSSGEMSRAAPLATMMAAVLTPPWPAAGEAARAALLAVFGAAAVMLAALGAGTRGVAWARRPPDALHATAAGLPVLALLVQALGWLGLVIPGVLATLVIAGVGIGWRSRPAIPRVAPDARATVAAAFAVAAVAVAACAPEVAWDAMVYHLRVPSLYLLAHRITPLPEIFPSFFPFSGEMLLLLARTLGGDPAARLLHVATWLGCAVAVARLAGRAWGPAARPWAAALFLTVPFGMVIASRAYVEFFMVLPLLAALDSSGPAAGSAVLAGWLAGAAFGTKYLGGIGAVLVAGLAWRRASLAPRTGLLLAAAGCAAGGAWLARNWLWTGNPVYPVLFGGPHWTPADMEGWRDDAHAFRGTVGEALATPWTLMARAGGDGALSPLLLMAAAVPLIWPAARTGSSWGLALALVAVWRVTSPLPRYLAFAAAVASAAAAGTVMGWNLGPASRRWSGRLTVLGLWGSAVCGVSAITFGTNSYAPAVGKVSREAYREGYFRPAGYPGVLQALTDRVPRHGRVYMLGHLFSYDLPRRVWFDLLYIRPPLYWWLAGSADPARIRVHARQAGLTHIAWLPAGTRAIYGGRPALMDWTPARLAGWKAFWQAWVHKVDRSGGWTIYEVADRPGRYPLPREGVPGAEGAGEGADVPAVR
jgi:hypothetical protein